MNRRAFTLIELLATLAIVILLAALVAPNVISVLGANRITEGARALLDQIDAARQHAFVQGLTVEVRLLKKPGEMHYTGIQRYVSGQPLDPVTSLPAGAAILDDATYSPWVSEMPDGASSGTAGLWSTGTYRSFKIRPSGGIEPTVVNRCRLFLTVAADRPVSAGGLANYATVQLNPSTARPLLYQP